MADVENQEAPAVDIQGMRPLENADKKPLYLLTSKIVLNIQISTSILALGRKNCSFNCFIIMDLWRLLESYKNPWWKLELYCCRRSRFVSLSML